MRLPALTVWMLAGIVTILATNPLLAEKRGLRVGGKSPEAYVAEQYGKAWAVVIGIDRYQQNVGSLRYAVADAKAVAQTLKQRGYEVTELYNERATKRAIEHELRTKLPRKVGEQDRVLIFYAGHGQDEKVRGGKTLGYLLPMDGERDDVPSTGISMGTVRELADALPAKHVLFLLDVCFGGIAGTLTRGSPPAVTEAYLRQITRERGRHLITAGAADQEVIESAQWGHSVFTYFLLKGLNDGMADQDDNGLITAQELYTYLESRVFGEAQQQGHTQTPQMAELSGEKGQFVFFTSAAGKAGLSPSPPIATRPAPKPSAALSQAEQELKALEEREKLAEEKKLLAIQQQIEAKKQKLEEARQEEERLQREREEEIRREADLRTRREAERIAREQAEQARMEEERRRKDAERLEVAEQRRRQQPKPAEEANLRQTQSLPDLIEQFKELINSRTQYPPTTFVGSNRCTLAWKDTRSHFKTFLRVMRAQAR